MTTTDQVRHTPGPWTIEGPTKGCEFPMLIGADYSEVAVVYPGDCADDAGRDEHPAMPNARLLRAAPELLHALRDVLNGLTLLQEGAPFSWDELMAHDEAAHVFRAWDAARAALATAEGDDQP